MAADQGLLAASHPLLTGALYVACGIYALSWLTAAITPRFARPVIASGAIVHLIALAGRGWIIGFFPLTGKMESFSAAALSLAIVAAISGWVDRRYLLSLLTLLLAAMLGSLTFPLDMRFPPPLMWTLWYPLHVPLSFLSYAIWCAAAAAGVAWFGDRDPVWLQRVDRLALQGLGLWSLSMICGGVWGVLAWGAYFMWDPKIIWSVILWFHYSAFIHVRLTPSLRRRPWVRPALAWVGVAWIFIAYVGTSFFFGRSSHAF